jgi:hypothetical protein
MKTRIREITQAARRSRISRRALGQMLLYGLYTVSGIWRIGTFWPEYGWHPNSSNIPAIAYVALTLITTVLAAKRAKRWAVLLLRRVKRVIDSTSNTRGA